MQKKERKLSRKEQQRKKNFDAICDTMIANGYIKYDLTVGVVAANVLAILVMAPFMALALWMFHLTVPNSAATFTARDGAVMLLMIIALILIHELLHGLTWGCFAKNRWKSIDFGVIWSMLTPLLHLCRIFKPVAVYFWGPDADTGVRIRSYGGRLHVT